LLLMLVVAIASGVATVHAQAVTTLERSTEPFLFDSVNPCNGEAVVLEGELTITTRITVDSRGMTHSAFTLVPSQVRGEGESGTAYKAVGGQREHLSFDQSAQFPFIGTFTDTFNLISADGTDNFTVTTLFHITVNADGTVHADVARITDACRG
jgi:hypothetical protein